MQLCFVININNMKKLIGTGIVIIFLTIVLIVLNGCSTDDPEIGVGPVKELKLEANINQDMVAKGKMTFDTKCAICHSFDKRIAGPPLKGITQKRKPEWIMNMVLNPDEMIKKNPHASALFKEYMIPMTFQNVSQDDARNILEYFRSIDSSK
jgi:cytochrome c